jgi:hypothetical protein
MAATILGLTTLTFGAPTVSGLVVNSASFTQSVNIAEVIDEDGDYVAASLHGRKVNGSISGTNAGGTFTIGATLSVVGAPAGTYYITEVAASRTADGFETVDITAQSWGF